MARFITNTPSRMYINDDENTPPFICMVDLDERIIESLRRVIRNWETHTQPPTSRRPSLTTLEASEPRRIKRRLL